MHISIHSVSNCSLAVDEMTFIDILSLSLPPLPPSLPPSLPLSLSLSLSLTQEKHAKCKQYVGHSAHVTHVSFSHDDRKLVSLGGADMSLMVWSHSAGSRDPAPTAATTGDHQSDPSSMTSLGYLSEESDTDSEEEGNRNSLSQLKNFMV